MVEEQKKLGRDVNPSYIWRYVKKLKEGNVNVYKSSKVVEINNEDAIIIGPEGEKVTIVSDTIILSSPLHPRNELAEHLEYAVGELYTIGDAIKPRRAHNATMDGYRTGLKI